MFIFISPAAGQPARASAREGLHSAATPRRPEAGVEIVIASATGPLTEAETGRRTHVVDARRERERPDWNEQAVGRQYMTIEEAVKAYLREWA